MIKQLLTHCLLRLIIVFFVLLMSAGCNRYHFYRRINRIDDKIDKLEGSKITREAKLNTVYLTLEDTLKQVDDFEVDTLLVSYTDPITQEKKSKKISEIEQIEFRSWLRGAYIGLLFGAGFGFLGGLIGAAIDIPEEALFGNEKNAKIGFWIGAPIGLVAGYSYGYEKTYLFDNYKTLKADKIQKQATIYLITIKDRKIRLVKSQVFDVVKRGKSTFIVISADDWIRINNFLSRESNRDK